MAHWPLIPGCQCSQCRTTNLASQKHKPPTIMIKTFLTILLLAAMLAFTGCRTAHGFGEDMEKAGDKIQEKTQ